ncbi:MAG: tetratricopeptide repeat protein [Acidiferrobacterales bacterium]
MNKSPFLWLLCAVCLGLTACASVAPQPVAEATVPVKPAHAALPKVALTPNILYQLLLGEIAGQRGHLNVAVREFTHAAMETRDPRIAERATLVSLYAHRPKEAEAAGKLWVNLRPDSIEAHEALATVMMDTGRMPQAKAQLERILELSPASDLGEAYLRIAAVLDRVPDHAEALRIMQSLAQLHPKLPEAQFAVASLAARNRDAKVAVQAIDRALQFRPNWEEAALFKMRILALQDNSQRVLVFSRKFLHSYPHATSFRINYARYLVHIQKWHMALTQFMRVAVENPSDPEAVYATGLLALQTNNADLASKYLKQDLKLQPDNNQARVYLGEIAEQRKQYEKAAGWYRQVPAGSHYFEAQVRLGVVMAKEGRLDNALTHLHQLHPESVRQRVQLALIEAQILRRAKRYPEAEKVLTAALEVQPDNIDLLYARALVEIKMNRLDLHEADLRKILKEDPTNADALNALGYTLADRTNRYQEALTLVQKALALRPGDPYIMDSMGWVQYRLGNDAEAVKYLRAALKRRPDPEISAHLGEVLWAMGQKTEAESVWGRALKAAPGNPKLLGVIKKFEP